MGSRKTQVTWARVLSTIAFTAAITAAFVATVLTMPAHAQVLYGALTGTVTDASGAIVAGAKVTAVETQTGVTQGAITDSAGIYHLPALLPGTYKVTITAQGFSTQETPGVVVRANELARVDAQLKVGSAAQNVTVTTEAPILQTDRADVRTNLTSQQVESLPIMGSQGRNFQRLLQTVPGTGLMAETNSLAGNPQRSINVNVNGQSNQTINTRIDGVQNAYPWLPANVAYVPPAEAIEAVNVVTNSFDAEQGSAGGAAVNVQIKSGQNQFHGGVQWFHTDQNFAARNYFQTDPKLFPKKNRNNQNTYSAELGGRIIKDKLFFFTDYERTTQRQLAGPDTRTLPTAAMANGDFRGLPGNPIIYDPATGDSHGATKQQVSCNGVLNVICPSRIDPAAAAMVKLLQPKIAQVVTTANGLNNWVGSGTAEFTRDNADFKVTYVPGAKSTVWGRYSFSKTFVFDPPLLGDAIGDATNGGQLGNAPGLIQSVGIGVAHTFTPSLLLDWNFGFTRQRLGSTFDLTSARGINDLKIPGTNNVGAPGDPSLYYGYPGFIFPTGQTPPGNTVPNNQAALGNAQPANPFLFRDQQFVTGANLSWNHGKHAFRGGIEWNHSQLNHFQPQGGTFQQPRGAFAFNGFVTAQQGTTPTWFNSWADFMFGLPALTGKARALFNPTALRWSQWAWYLQDHWQVVPDVTLTLGVRWEFYPFGYSDNGKGLRLLNLNTGNVLIGGFGSVPRNDGVDIGGGRFLPRVGVAWRVKPSTVLRAGYGQSADPNNWRYFRNAYPAVLLDTNQPANTASYIPTASLTGLNATGLGGGSYSVPAGLVLAPLPDLSSGSIALPKNISTTTIPNPFHRGYIQSWNLTVQQEMGHGAVFETGYVGARAVRPLVAMNLNTTAPGSGTAAGGLFGSTSPINGMVPFKSNYYHSLQTKLTQRWGSSSAGVAFTWGKAISYADNEDLAAMTFPYPGSWQKNRGPANFDRTINIQIFGVMQLPFGKDQHWLQSGPGNWLLGGWQVSPLISILSGAPFTVTANGNLNGVGLTTQAADLVGIYRRTHGKPLRTGQTCAQTDLTCHFFDPAAFAAPLITNAATAHFGNTNRNEFRGPGYFSMNLSLSRDFRFREHYSLQIRADAFSLTNTPHFANPNAGCPGDATTVGPIPGSGQLCSTGTNNNFGVITGTNQPGGFFGPDPGNRTLWLGASLKF